MAFKRAVKSKAKGRVALIGPAGSGKSVTMLKLAKALAGTGSRKIAAVDTEHGSLSKYAHTPQCGGEGKCQDPMHFDFDVDELASFSPQAFMKSLSEAERGGYAVFCCDSLSHFWMGKDGALEFVDSAKRRSSSRDDMSGWKDFSPIERSMFDAMISSPCHVIVTMRTKTEYQEEEYTTSKGERKKKRVKVGLAPVQRQGLEYEMDLIGYMDEDNTFITDKTRCPDYTGKTIKKPSEKDFAPFVEWLDGAPVQERAPIPMQQAESTPVVGQVFGNRESAAAVAEEKIEALKAQSEKPAARKKATPTQIDFLPHFAEAKKQLHELTGNDATYYSVLNANGYEKSNAIKDTDEARCIYKLLCGQINDLRLVNQEVPANA